MNRKLISIVLLLCMLCTSSPYLHIAKANETESNQLSTPTFVRARSYKAKKIKITWNKVDGADSYQVYQKKKKKFVKVADVKANKKKWLSPKTKSYQTYMVRACKKGNGTVQYSGFSYTVGARPYKKNAKKVNAGMIYSKKYQYNMGLYETAAPEIVIEKSKYSKNKKAVVVDTSLRWYSTDESIVTVNEKGVIHSQNTTGQCQVYARAHNGNYTKKIDVNVSRYAYPAKFENLESTQPLMEDFVNKYQEDMKAIAEYFEIREKNGNVKNGVFKISEDRTRIETNLHEEEYAPVKQNLWNILSDYPRDLEIGAGRGVSFDLSYYPYHIRLVYLFIDHELDPYGPHFMIAPRWVYGFWQYNI